MNGAFILCLRLILSIKEDISDGTCSMPHLSYLRVTCFLGIVVIKASWLVGFLGLIVNQLIISLIVIE